MATGNVDEWRRVYRNERIRQRGNERQDRAKRERSSSSSSSSSSASSLGRGACWRYSVPCGFRTVDQFHLEKHNGGLPGRIVPRRRRSERSGNFSSVETGPTSMCVCVCVSGEARREKRSTKPEPIETRATNRMATDALSRDDK